jgi:anti-anti-sigma factor
VEFSISGEFTIFFLNQLRLDMERDMQAGKVLYFIFDLAGVTYIDSAAMGILLMAARYNDKKGRTLSVKNTIDAVKKAIDGAGIDLIEFA